METRALHYVLSFDTAKWERFMTLNEVNNCMEKFNLFYFHDYQHICYLHNKKNQIHFHIVVNPVSITDHKILHYSMEDYRNWYKDMAFTLGVSFGFAIQNISYIDEKGCFRYGNEKGGFMYQNRDYYW